MPTDWRNEVKRTLIEGGNLENAFYDRGTRSLKIFGVLGTVVALIILFYFFHSSTIFRNVYLSCFDFMV